MTIKRGEVWLANLNPIRGSEQAGTRPVLIFQNDLINNYTTTVLAIPFTTNLRRATLPSCVLVRKGEGGLTEDSVRVQESDYSLITQSRIYEFLSEEISKAALANVDMSRLKDRLGNKGELHPSQYQVVFREDFVINEALGIRRSHVIEAITHPESVLHLRAKHAVGNYDPRVTISVKSVSSKKVEDRFLLFVISGRIGQAQHVLAAFRAYFSDVDLINATAPIDVVKSFVNTYGLTFRLGNTVSKFIYDSLLEIDSSIYSRTALDQMQPLDGLKGNYYIPLLAGNDTQWHGTAGMLVSEVALAFVVDVSRYVATLRKHNVALTSEDEWQFARL